MSYDASLLLTAEAELARLDAHFTSTLGWLHARRPPGIGRAQARARARHIERLESYRARRRFPQNQRFPGRKLPHFIDEQGTRCAMAHLMEASGAGELVHRIAHERNLARIRELADIPQLVAWLGGSGLTLEEAARIQPSYCASPAQGCVCGDAFASGIVQGKLGDGGTNLIVNAVYGPATGVKIGDSVPFSDPAGLVAPGDIVFATWSGQGTAYVNYVAHAQAPDAGEPSVLVPSSACWFNETVPGPLPLHVLRQALSAQSEGSCEQVLTQYDAAWNSTGGCYSVDGGAGGMPATGGSSGTTSTGGTAGAGTSGGSGGSGARANGADNGGGCSIAGAPSLGSEAMVAIAAAVVARGLRRRTRRR